MAIFRNVHVSFWEDNKVVDNFTPKDKLFMLYLLTNPHTSLTGCYEISLKQMSNELGYDLATIKNLLGRMEEYHKVILYSENTKEILIKNWSKYNWTKSEKLKKPIIKEIENIKDEKLKKYMVEIGYRYGILKKEYPMDTTDSISISDSDTDYNKIIDYYKKYINININSSSIEFEKLNYWFEYFKENAFEIIKYAIDICIMNQATTMPYLEGILRNWKNANYTSLNEIKKEESKKENVSPEKSEEFQEIFDYNWLDNNDSGD